MICVLSDPSNLAESIFPTSVCQWNVCVCVCLYIHIHIPINDELTSSVNIRRILAFWRYVCC